MTPPVRIKLLLKRHLDDLTDEEMKTFKWHLADRRGSKALHRSEMDITREETVDKMVEFYRAEGAVAATVDILYDMKKNDSAMSLVKATAGPNVEQQSNEPSTSTIHSGGSQFDPSAGHSSEVILHFQTPPRIVRQKREAFERVRQFYDSCIEYIQTQRSTTEQKIKADFKELHRLLRTEKKTRIAALDEEEAQKIHIMQKITELNRDTFSLSDTVKDLEDLGADDSFIKNFKTEMEKAQNALPDPQLLPQALIDVPEHVENLQFRVLETMLSNVKHTPVVLDPNTASPCLSLSDDLTKVTVTDTWQNRPGNLERNSSYPHVLGWEGFDSGKHCWEMVVGNQTGWILGVAEEVKDREDDEMRSTPQKGICTIRKSNRGYTDIKGNTLALATTPNKIRVELDYENGTVSFHDAENNTPIQTYKETFTQKLYPYFAFVKMDDNNNKGVKRKRRREDSSGGFIQICQSKVSLTVT